MFKRILSALLSCTLIAGAAITISGCNQNQETTDYKLAEKTSEGSILHCFCWDFNTIKNSMEDIAAAGFTSLQTSPINECLEGDNGGMQLYGNGKWYYNYQPTDWTIGNYQLGTKDEFKSMCEEADKYGIKVIVDVVPNHTTPETSAVNENLINAVGGMDKLYHKGSQYDLKNYSDRLQCTTYKMGGLPDVNTENPDFQNYYINFVNDCIDCGADGFRYDTAKHIGLPDDSKEDDGFTNNFWERALTEVNNADKMFNYGEVLQGNNDRINDYMDTIGYTTASAYGSKIRGAVSQNNLGTSMFSDYFIGNEKMHIVTWVESHDNYINDGNWATMSENQVLLGYAIIGSRQAGVPLLFDRPYGSNSDNQWGTENRIGASGSDMYKSDIVKATNFFRIAMNGEEEELVNPNSDNSSVVIERGKKGAVIVNTKGELATDFDINLPDGTYVDRVTNSTTYTVKGGKLTSDSPIPENTAVVLYNTDYVNYATNATVSIDDVDMNYSGDSVDVTLRCENAEDAEYTISKDSNNETKSYEDVYTVTITPGEDGITKLALTATSKKGVKTYKEFVFTNTKSTVGSSANPASTGDTIYFEKPSAWSDNMYAYVYEKVSGEAETAWPGFQMQKDDDGKFSYKLKSDFDDALVIFTDGTNQYPAQNQPGLAFEADKTYTK